MFIYLYFLMIPAPSGCSRDVIFSGRKTSLMFLQLSCNGKKDKGFPEWQV